MVSLPIHVDTSICPVLALRCYITPTELLRRDKAVFIALKAPLEPYHLWLWQKTYSLVSICQVLKAEASQQSPLDQPVRPWPSTKERTPKWSNLLDDGSQRKSSMDIMSIAEHLKISLVLFFHSIGDLWNMAHEIFFCMFYLLVIKIKNF